MLQLPPLSYSTQNTCAQQEADIELKKQEITRLQEANDHLEGVNSSTKKFMTDTVKDLTTQLKSVNAQHEKGTEDFYRLSVDHSALSTKIIELEGQFSKATTHIAELSEAVQLADETVVTLNGTMEGLESDNATMTQQLKELNLQIRDQALLRSNLLKSHQELSDGNGQLVQTIEVHPRPRSQIIFVRLYHQEFILWSAGLPALLAYNLSRFTTYCQNKSQCIHRS